MMLWDGSPHHWFGNPTLINPVLTTKNNGNVGIGIADPANKLQVNGANGATIGIDGGARNSGFNIAQAGLNRWSLFVRKWQSDNFIVRDEAANADTMVFPSGTGKVGIGTADVDGKLHVAGGSGKAIHGKASNALNLAGYGVYGEALYNDGPGVYGRNATKSHFGYLGGSDRGFHGEHSSGNTGLLGGSDYAVKAEGDLIVTGAYRGPIGPNNGAPFPRPAYDSGWRAISQAQHLTLYYKHRPRHQQPRDRPAVQGYLHVRCRNTQLGARPIIR